MGTIAGFKLSLTALMVCGSLEETRIQAVNW